MTGTKDDKQKPMPRLVLGTMARALLEVSKVATFGAEKYSPDNWLKVENGLDRYTDAKDRHRLEGAISEYDSESGLLHAAHEAWNALAVLELKLRAADAVTESDWPADDRIEAIGQNGNDGAVYESQCWCEECSIRTVTLPGTGKPLEIRAMMALCPQCGDKRCERAKRHVNECSAKKQYRDLEKPETWKVGDYARVKRKGKEVAGMVIDIYQNHNSTTYIVLNSDQIPHHHMFFTSVEARS